MNLRKEKKTETDYCSPEKMLLPKNTKPALGTMLKWYEILENLHYMSIDVTIKIHVAQMVGWSLGWWLNVSIRPRTRTSTKWPGRAAPALGGIVMRVSKNNKNNGSNKPTLVVACSAKR